MIAKIHIMKKLLLILLSTVITSLQAQNYADLNENFTIENPVYLKNKANATSIETLKTMDNLPPYKHTALDNIYTSRNDKSRFTRVK